MTQQLKVNKTFAINEQVSHSSTTDVNHPTSVVDSTNLHGLGLNFALFIMPECSDHGVQVILSVFVNGDQHVVFSGDVAGAKDFFAKFPKN